jgi:drug/metabolite transporter (DMT)-like permease
MTAPLPPPAARTRLVGAGLLAVSGAGFATLAILAKLAYAEGLVLTEILTLRFGGAAALLIGYLLMRRPRRLLDGGRRVWALFLLGALGYAVQASLFVGALQRIPASISALVLYSYPAFVALLAWRVHRRVPMPMERIAMGLALAGVVLTIGPLGPLDPLDRLDGPGVGMALASAGWYAGYILVSDRVTRGAGSLVSTAWITLGAFVSFTVAGALVGGLPGRLSPAAAAIMLAMVVFSTILPIGTFLAGLRRVGPTAAALLSTLEPVFTVVLAALLLGEGLSALQLLGGGLVLAAVVLLSLPARPRVTTVEAHA